MHLEKLKTKVHVDHVGPLLPLELQKLNGLLQRDLLTLLWKFLISRNNSLWIVHGIKEMKDVMEDSKMPPLSI